MQYHHAKQCYTMQQQTAEFYFKVYLFQEAYVVQAPPVTLLICLLGQV